MRKILVVIAGIGLWIAPSIKAQQPISNASRGVEPDVKPCVVVFGAVRSPARLELRRRFHLAEALIAVGGLTDHAASTVRVIKSGTKCFPAPAIQLSKSAPASVQSAVYEIADIRGRDQKANPYLEAGDVVIVAELDSIFVTGAVANQMEIYLNQPLTLTRALKLAGNVRSDAKISKIVIYRQEKGSIEGSSITVDLDAIRKHRVGDPILQPFDIVEVPPLGPRKVGPPLSYPTFDSRPLIPLGYRVIY
jgi:protein involved in polysaccharide export with SLBB domain